MIVNGLIIIAELPFTLTYLYHGFVRDMVICSGWVLVNYTLFMLSISLTAWTSIERYLFIYHEQFIKRHSILLHYFPVGIHFIYTPVFYVALVIFYPCQQTYTPYSYICGGPCYLFQIVPCMIDWGFNVGFVLLITCVVNIVLIISNIRQRDRMKKAIITARNSQQWVKKSRITFFSDQFFSLSASDNETQCSIIFHLYTLHYWMDSIWCCFNHANFCRYTFVGLHSCHIFHLFTICSNIIFTIRLFILYARN